VVVLVLTAPVELSLFPLASHLAAINHADTLAPAYYARPNLPTFLWAVYRIVDGGGFGSLVLASAAAILLAAHVVERFGLRPPRTRSAAGMSDLEIAMIALCVVPIFAITFSVLVTKSFSGRYMAGAALLPAMAIPYMLDKLAWRRIAPLLLVPLPLTALVIHAHWRDPVAQALSVVHQAEPAAPIIVGEGKLYIELMAAADAGTRSRLVYLKRPAGALTPDPTNENEVVRLASFHPEYRVSARAVFLRRHDQFFLLSRLRKSTDTTTPYLSSSGELGGLVCAKNGILLFRSAAFDANRHAGGDR
jgi:hypothetical protein